MENLLTQLQAAAPYSTHPVVRIPWNDMVTIKRVLDIGAQSLLVPTCRPRMKRSRGVVYALPARGRAGMAGTTRAPRFEHPGLRRRAQEEIASWCRSRRSKRSIIIEAICGIGASTACSSDR